MLLRHETQTNSVLSQQESQSMMELLSQHLADTYALYLKTQNFHWNVKGTHFRALHSLFEEQYRELAEAADTLAERIRALGYPAPGTFGEFSRRTMIDDGDGDLPSSEMVADLLEDHEKMIRSLHEMIAKAEKARDYATMDLLVERSAAHEKTAWMLKSLTEE